MDCPVPNATVIGRPEGTGSLGVLILGEALGSAEEEDHGLPFRPWGEAGSVLERAIRRAGFLREQFVLFNVVPCHPPQDWLVGAPWEHAAIEWGRPQVENVIATYQPKVILALGAVATRTMTGLAGTKLGMNYLTGFLVPAIRLGLPPVIPCFHPSYLRRGAMSLLGVLIRCIRLAVQVSREGRQPIQPPVDNPPPGYILRPTELEAEQFTREIEHGQVDFVAYDIETAYSTAEHEAEEKNAEVGAILSIQFSARPDSGIYFPWREPFIGYAKRILATPTRKISWNGWKFDDPLLDAAGLQIGGESHDGMWAWHHLQPDLPRSLQFAAAQLGWPYPWKHLDAQGPAFYGITDVAVLSWMFGRTPSLFHDLQRKGLWRSYMRHVVGLEPILREMADRGMPVSRSRHEEINIRLDSECAALRAEMQALVPETVKTLKPYKRVPKNLDGCVQRDGVWYRVSPWAPSNQGLIRYMKFRGHTVPTDYKTGKKTTGELELKRLARSTDDPLYWKVLAFKKLSTVLDNHLPGWRPDADDRVRSTFYFDPATGQLSSRRPNLQNAPKHPPKDIKGLETNPADLFRSMVEARDGHVLLEFDFRSFHAQTLAFEAEDPDYLRLAKLDIHSFLAAHLVRDPDAQRSIAWPDDELRSYLARIKKAHKFERDFKAKRAILGYGFGMGWKKLYEMNRESFASQWEAKRTTEMLDSLFPRCKKWRDEIRARAHSQGYLISRHGYIRYFWEVLRFRYSNGQSIASPGDDSEAAIAFLPANDAFGEIKDRMLTLNERGLLAKYGLVNQIHDALLFECPLEFVEEACAIVPQIMTAPSKILINPVCPGGLSVEISVTKGKKWNCMTEIA